MPGVEACWTVSVDGDGVPVNTFVPPLVLLDIDKVAATAVFESQSADTHISV